MAARWENVLQGYDVSRFEGDIREDLLCSICHDVPKDPRLCQNKDHIFCFAHISRHLHQNSHTCPVCRDPLTPETLRRPTGFLKNYLEDLKIKCDQHDRGCPDVVRLEDLQRHVDQCGFAPVMCGNEGCGTVVNRKDKEIHERYHCQFRIAKCHECREIKASQNGMKTSQDEMKASQDEIKVQITRMEEQIKESQAEMKVQIEEIERKQDEMKDDMKLELNEMKDKIIGMEGKQERTKQSVDEMRQQFEKMMIMVHQALQGSNVNNNGAQDIIILGGYYAPALESVSNTVEKYNIAEGKSTPLPRMNLPRAESASCVYNGAVIVTGGFDGQDGTDLIEILKMNQHPLRWKMFHGKLSVKLSAHDVIVYQDKLYIIGGDNWNEKKISDAIYELALVPPYTAKLLARMPQPRISHRAEIVNGKLFILGGMKTAKSKDAIDSVVVYDFIKNEIKPCTSLPKPVWGMSTVTWGNMIIVICGVYKNSQVSNDVIMYDTETGRSERLPSLKQNRYGSSAVIMHDVIVVLGGRNKEQGYLDSVESFTMGDDQWKELLGMKEKRYLSTAVVKPRN